MPYKFPAGNDYGKQKFPRFKLAKLFTITPLSSNYFFYSFQNGILPSPTIFGKHENSWLLTM